ncbi:UDP-glucose 4-epimerase GalE [Inmirania thermothiophila]|uniref:UDP-glucose 4-epimerase n=1 Tax=Inmirania thermothiophila TaxID=1750597 RepID=A0A3N1Y2M2_9GAMM|nr:UDP-glucose 4-epimerase GalE [Inmirania thermothiophila]ROR32791.1 UDP-glucose 4-epimerase [Inmirania thermothiophila]
MARHVLVVGGAGYIGSHMVALLAERGHAVTVLDDLSSGHRDAVLAGELVVGDLGDRALLDALLGGRRFDAVMHFAARIQVAESVAQPARYYRNNVAATLTLLEAMLAHGVGAFVFSSTAAVYGEPQRVPIDEDHPKAPVNPYGRSKWMVEQMLADLEAAHGLRSVSLRYFNAAGADPAGRLGERHDPETHLIPLVLQAAAGRREAVTVFGTDYDTHDGTCIRDYVHVADLCEAHLLALERLWAGAPGGAFNLGNGNGFSVREVIETARRVTGRAIRVREGPRRAGDPARLVADSRRAREVLGWRPRHDALETIVAHAWAWESARA